MGGQWKASGNTSERSRESGEGQGMVRGRESAGERALGTSIVKLYRLRAWLFAWCCMLSTWRAGGLAKGWVNGQWRNI